MKRVKYLNNRDLLAQIHASKNTYCSYVAPEDASYDLIVPNLKKSQRQCGGTGQEGQGQEADAGSVGGGQGFGTQED